LRSKSAPARTVEQPVAVDAEAILERIDDLSDSEAVALLAELREARTAS
jgi:hypothetical protein